MKKIKKPKPNHIQRERHYRQSKYDTRTGPIYVKPSVMRRFRKLAFAIMNHERHECSRADEQGGGGRRTRHRSGLSRSEHMYHNNAIGSILVPWHYTIEHALLLKVLINTILGP